MQARRAVEQYPDMVVPTGRIAEDGAPIMVRASDALTHAETTLTEAKTTSENIFRTAAACLLGAL
jgi:hypothetical protein